MGQARKRRTRRRFVVLGVRLLDETAPSPIGAEGARRGRHGSEGLGVSGADRRRPHHSAAGIHLPSLWLVILAELAILPLEDTTPRPPDDNAAGPMFPSPARLKAVRASVQPIQGSDRCIGWRVTVSRGAKA
jgi:hypothetical protein